MPTVNTEFNYPKTLVMSYTVSREYRATVQPDAGGVGRAIEECTRLMSNEPFIDAPSIRFRVED